MERDHFRETKLFSDGKKERNEVVILSLVEKLTSLGSLVSDLLADLPLIGKFYQTINYAGIKFKSRKFLSEYGEELSFESNDLGEIKFVITIPSTTPPEDYDEWKNLGILPPNYSGTIYYSGKVIRFQVTRNNSGKSVVQTDNDQNYNDIIRLTQFIEAAEKILKVGFDRLPLYDSSSVSKENTDVVNLYPPGGIILNTKNAI